MTEDHIVNENDKGKQIAVLTNFLKEFIKEGKTNKESPNIKVLGHLVWKLKIKKSAEDEDKKGSNVNSADENEDFDYNATEFTFSGELSINIAELILEKLEKQFRNKYSEVEFEVNKKLFQRTYGYKKEWSYPLMEKYLKSFNSSTSRDKKNLISIDKGKRKIRDGTSIALEFKKVIDGTQESLVFINLVNLKNTLSNNKRKIILNLDKLSKAERISQDILILEPDKFDCAVCGDELFVFNLTYFQYMFEPIEELKKLIRSNQDEMEKNSIINSEALITYSERDHNYVRDLSYFVGAGAKIDSPDKIKSDIEFIKPYTKSENLFDVSDDGRIICNENNAGLVLSYISKKMGLLVSDRRLRNIEASSEI